MDNLLILDILTRALGSPKKTSNGNYSFKCPNECHFLKNKLEININTYQYQCWICGNQKNGYKGKNLIKLLTQNKSSHSLINEIKPFINNQSINTTIEVIDKKIELPEYYKNLLNISVKNIIGRHARSYLNLRGITNDDIIKYNIGYCDEGPYKNRIIIPTYNYNGELNFFTGRSFEKDTFIKYKNPTISKDIIPNEYFINWNLPIILCEGIFDAITIKRNTIPLLGKTISQNLMKKIITSSVSKIYIALDKDALKDSLYFCEILLNENKEVYLVEMQDKDPSQLGFQKFTELIQTTLPLTYYDLMGKKLQL